VLAVGENVERIAETCRNSVRCLCEQGTHARPYDHRRRAGRGSISRPIIGSGIFIPRPFCSGCEYAGRLPLPRSTDRR
jgi:hypothetical protein